MKKCMFVFLVAAAVAAHGETWYIDAAAAKDHSTAKSKPFGVPCLLAERAALEIQETRP